MAKKRKKRNMNSYALGTGSAGTVKHYLPTPAETMRENEIMMDKIEYDVANNPWTMALDTVGGMAIEYGMSMATSGAGGGGKKAGFKGSTGVDQSFTEGIDNPTNFMGGGAEGMETQTRYAAKGTGPQGTGVEVEAEGGEVEQQPGQAPVALEGDLHSEGGIDRMVKEGTLYFSNQVKIGGKTAAERKKIREREMTKISKVLEKDPTDAVQKETFKRMTEKFEMEEQSDLKVQEFAKNVDKVYDKAMMAAYGTSQEGVQKMGKGGEVGDETSFWDGTKDYLGSFTGGDIMSLAGNLYSGISGLNQAKKNAAENTVNENFYKGYEDEALKTIEEASGYIKGQQAEAGKDVAVRRNDAIARNRNSARGVNTQRAMDLGADVIANRAMGDIYTNFTKVMMDNLYKKSGVQEKAGQITAQEEKAADIANRMDKDNVDTQIGVAKESMGRAMQQTGKDLNQHSESEYMQNVYSEMFGNDVNWQRGGTLGTSPTNPGAVSTEPRPVTPDNGSNYTGKGNVAPPPAPTTVDDAGLASATDTKNYTLSEIDTSKTSDAYYDDPAMKKAVAAYKAGDTDEYNRIKNFLMRKYGLIK